MKALCYTLLALAVICFCAVFGCWFAGMWLNDGRWGWTGTILVVPLAVFTLVGSLTVDEL
jgi:drug/metabolite transporter superfamily protein YnfA